MCTTFVDNEKQSFHYTYGKCWAYIWLIWSYIRCCVCSITYTSQTHNIVCIAPGEVGFGEAQRRCPWITATRVQVGWMFWGNGRKACGDGYGGFRSRLDDYVWLGTGRRCLQAHFTTGNGILTVGCSGCQCLALLKWEGLCGLLKLSVLHGIDKQLVDTMFFNEYTFMFARWFALYLFCS